MASIFDSPQLEATVPHPPKSSSCFCGSPSCSVNATKTGICSFPVTSSDSAPHHGSENSECIGGSPVVQLGVVNERSCHRRTNVATCPWPSMSTKGPCAEAAVTTAAASLPGAVLRTRLVATSPTVVQRPATSAAIVLKSSTLMCVRPLGTHDASVRHSSPAAKHAHGAHTPGPSVLWKLRHLHTARITILYLLPFQRLKHGGSLLRNIGHTSVHKGILPGEHHLHVRITCALGETPKRRGCTPHAQDASAPTQAREHGMGGTTRPLSPARMSKYTHSPRQVQSCVDKHEAPAHSRTLAITCAKVTAWTARSGEGEADKNTSRGCVMPGCGSTGSSTPQGPPAPGNNARAA